MEFHRAFRFLQASHSTINMGLGVLEPKSQEKVPGTVHVERLTAQQQQLTSNLKHGTGKDEHIVLVPQPSDSPNDPLSAYFGASFEPECT